MTTSRLGLDRIAAAALLAAALALAAVALAALGPGDARAKRGPTCVDAHADPANLNETEAGKAIRCLINKRRSNHGAGAVEANGKLGRAAGNHTDFMLDHGCFAHECSGEPDMVSRIKRTGYLQSALSWAVGENIAWGDQGLGSPAEIVAAWMDSPPHRAALLDRSYEHVGVGMLHGTPSSPKAHGAVYTTDFGFKHG
jgi:uncharacterized protein YkwD